MNYPANQSSKQKEKKLSPVCPYIGMKEDSSTFFSYPSPGNHCYHEKPNQPIKSAYQEEFWISLSYPTCQVYLPSWEGPLPQEIFGETSQTETLISYAAVIPTNIQNVSLAKGEGVTDTPTSIPPSVTPSPSSSQIPEPTSTPTEVHPTPGPVMKTPFGPEKRFVLYTVKQVESYNKIGETYQTPNEVIQETNDLIGGTSPWVDTILVIMPGQTESSGVPNFRIVLLENPTSSSDLAEEHGVSADEVIYYNSLGSIEIIPTGRWLIIPIEN